VQTARVADKVGFMDGLLHDAAIVYGPNGTYVLAVMTDGSSWATIADLDKTNRHPPRSVVFTDAPVFTP
jgi:hypothetical protein